MKKLSLLLISCLALWSCQSPANKETKNQNVAHENHHEEIKNEHINLNQGAKWLVNAEMKPYVIAGENLVEEYLKQDKTDYQALVSDLTIQNEQLVKSCTMKGESHEELHKWLHPHLELVKKLAAAKDTSEAKAIVVQIQQSYQTYKEYFD